MTEIKIIIYETNSLLERLASFAAKQALLGKSIIIVNCEDAIISGRKSSIINEYKEARQRGGSSLRGPHFPNIPERLVKRTIRGMLPYKKGRGLLAFKRIICFNNTPPEYENSEKISFSKIFKIKKINLKELSNRI